MARMGPTPVSTGARRDQGLTPGHAGNFKGSRPFRRPHQLITARGTLERGSPTMTDALHRLARATLLAPFPGAKPPDWLLDELENGLGGVTLFALNGNVPDVA